MGGLRIVPMTAQYARAASRWVYPGEYAFYDMDGSDELIDELLGGEYLAATDESGALIGFFCFGDGARIPTLEGYPAGEGDADFGLGMRPDLCGRGLGEGFVNAGIGCAARRDPARGLRLAVAAFNRRAITVYGRCGFSPLREVTHSATGTRFVIMRRDARSEV